MLQTVVGFCLTYSELLLGGFSLKVINRWYLTNLLHETISGFYFIPDVS